MLIEAIFPPNFTRNEALARDASAAGRYLSSVNADLYQTFDRGTFQEALADWGYFGPAGSRPSWLT
jgi:hypothetical protein